MQPSSLVDGALIIGPPHSSHVRLVTKLQFSSSFFPMRSFDNAGDTGFGCILLLETFHLLSDELDVLLSWIS
jgi:hypothetical protein